MKEDHAVRCPRRGFRDGSTWRCSFLSSIAILLTLCAVLLLATPAAHAIDSRFLRANAAADGSIARAADVATPYQATAEAAITLHLSDENASSQISAALDYLQRAAPATTEELSLLVRNKQLAGVSPLGDITRLLQHQNPDGGFGGRTGFDSNVLDTAFALEAIAAAGQQNSPSARDALGYLLGRQHTAGSWSLANNAQGGGVDYISAIVLRAVWQYRALYDLAVPLERAQAYLLGRRDASGVWSDDALTALALLAIVPRLPNLDPVAPALASVQARQTAEGSWSGDVYTTSLLLRVLAAAQNPVPNPDLGTVRGRIVNATTDQGLAGATVQLSGARSATVSTDDEGRFSFTGLSAGSYQVDGSAGGFSGFSNLLNLTAGATVDLGVIPLNPAVVATTATVRGVITRADNGTVLSGATIAVGTRTATSGSDGRYEITGIAPGPSTITVSRSGFAGVSATANATAGSTIVFSPALALQSLAPRIQGAITDTSGRQIPGGVVITLSGANTRTVNSSTGTYSITGLIAGPTNVSVTASGFTPVAVDIELEEGSVYDFSPSLAPVGAATTAVQGVVLNASTRAAISGAMVTLSGANSRMLQADTQGRFRFNDLVPGETTITVTATDYESLTGTTVLEAGQNVFVPVELLPVGFEPPVAEVTGRVLVTGTSNPIPGAIVEISRGEERIVAIANDDGQFTLPGVSSGRWSVTVRRTNYEAQDTVFFMATPPTHINLGSLFLTEKVRFPDLSIRSLSRSALQSDPANFNVSGALTGIVENIGRHQTRSGFEVIAYYDADSSGTYNETVDRLLGSQRVTATIAAGDTQPFSIPVTGQLPFRDAPVRVRLDTGSEVAEMLEDNNDGNTCELAACGD